MQIFELHFNPKLKEDQFFDSFIYKPENIYEKKLGGLYMVGEIQNALPKSERFLNNLSQVVKKNYYTLSAKSSEKALSHALKKANDFLSEEVKNNNVNWLGNLNFATLSLNNSKLVFSKTGNLKILLIRAGQINDISKNLNLQDIEPYPLKIFFNVISGKLVQNDIILVLTKEISEFFYEENTITKIAKIFRQEKINEKNLKEILPSSLFDKGKGSKISGICLLVAITETPQQQLGTTRIRPQSEKEVKKISFQKKRKSFFSEIKSLFRFPKIIKKPKLSKSFVFLIKKTRDRINPVKFASRLIKKLHLSKKTKIKAFGSIRKKSLIKYIKPKIAKRREKANFLDIKKILILIFVLILILFFGFLIFKKAGQEKKNEVKSSLEEIQRKVDQADNFLIFKNEEKANSLFIEAWKEILPLIETKTSLKPDVVSLKQSIEKNLEDLNKLEIIENPEIATGLDMNLFSSPSGSLVESPPFDFNFDLSASYLSNLYFLDKKTCKVIKYPYLSESNWGVPKKWMEDNEHCLNPKSMAVDGSVWILNEDNSVSRYYIGSYEETINLNFFPSPENITRIKTAANLPYLYLLEPTQKRIIITDKAGKIIKQFKSEKFDNLKNFVFSENGKTIWLLNNSDIYKVKI